MPRPNAISHLPVPAEVTALSRNSALERWNAGLRAAGDGSDNNVITMYDMIGHDYWSGGGVTAKRVAAALRAIGDKDVEVHINSPGGDMFEGIAIYNLLREHPRNVTVKIMGMAASAASIIAMAGDTIQIGAASFLMIHNCWVLASGNRHDMAETAAFLEPFDKAMADVYASRTGEKFETVTGWMNAEKWIGGNDAVTLGFADELLSADQISEDAAARDNAKALHAVRQAELTLCASMSRKDARALINEIKSGTPGAAATVTPGADDAAWMEAGFAALSSLKKR